MENSKQDTANRSLADQTLIDECNSSETVFFLGVSKTRTVVRYKKSKYIANRRLGVAEIRDLLDQWIRTDLFDFELHHGR